MLDGVSQRKESPEGAGPGVATRALGGGQWESVDSNSGRREGIGCRAKGVNGWGAGGERREALGTGGAGI